MKVSVVGKKKSVFVEEKTGELKQFARLYYTHKSPSDTNIVTYEGIVADSCSIPFCDVDSIPVNSVVYLDFDKQGKVIGIEVEEKKDGEN